MTEVRRDRAVTWRVKYYSECKKVSLRGSVVLGPPRKVLRTPRHGYNLPSLYRVRVSTVSGTFSKAAAK